MQQQQQLEEGQMNQYYVVLGTILSSSIRRDNFAATSKTCNKYAVVAIPPHDTSVSWQNEFYMVLGPYLVPGKFP